jgi:hypothetical protein
MFGSMRLNFSNQQTPPLLANKDVWLVTISLDLSFWNFLCYY